LIQIGAAKGIKLADLRRWTREELDLISHQNMFEETQWFWCAWLCMVVEWIVLSEITVRTKFPAARDVAVLRLYLQIFRVASIAGYSRPCLRDEACIDVTAWESG